MKGLGKLGTVETRSRMTVVIGVVAFVLLTLFLLPSVMGSSSVSERLRVDKFPESFRIAVIADLDNGSRREDDKGKVHWASTYITGTLRRSGNAYTVSWDKASDVITSHNEAGRGCELSELVKFDGKLYTFDDRTGIMFELVNGDRSDVASASAPYLVPRHIFMEGDGASNDKGLKIEWATVKDGKLYVGSFGKEFTNNKGQIMHSNNLWAVTVTRDHKYEHVDWRGAYGAMRTALGYEHPGYLLHEAIVWSPHHQQWFVLPRRMSREAYNDVEDEKRGANTIIMASADFTTITAKTVGVKTPERGFSSAKFLPGSKDTVLVALKTEENAAEGTQNTYITIYGEQPDGEWSVLLEETPLPVEHKFEGIEILSYS